MAMDKMVAKPENHGLPAGWSGFMQGMMTFLRVLPPDEYDEVMRRVERGAIVVDLGGTFAPASSAQFDVPVVGISSDLFPSGCTDLGETIRSVSQQTFFTMQGTYEFIVSVDHRFVRSPHHDCIRQRR